MYIFGIILALSLDVYGCGFGCFSSSIYIDGHLPIEDSPHYGKEEDKHFVYTNIEEVEAFYRDHRYNDPAAVYWSCARITRKNPPNLDDLARVLLMLSGLRKILSNPKYHAENVSVNAINGLESKVWDIFCKINEQDLAREMGLKDERKTSKIKTTRH